MWKFILRLIFGGKPKKPKYTNIKEPPGGIDGMTWDRARLYAMSRSDFHAYRVSWPAGDYVYYIRLTGHWMRSNKDDSFSQGWSPDTSDSVSCDWQVTADVASAGKRPKAKGQRP